MSILKNQERSLKVKTTLSVSALVLTVTFLLPLAGMQLFASEVKSLDPPPIEKTDTDLKKQKLPGPDDFVPLETLPAAIKMADPEYPVKAKKKGIEGDVWIKALILKDGTVKKALIYKTSGVKLLDKSALAAAYKSTFKPGIQNTQPVACWIAYKVSFKLDKKDKTAKDDQ